MIITPKLDRADAPALPTSDDPRDFWLSGYNTACQDARREVDVVREAARQADESPWQVVGTHPNLLDPESTYTVVDTVRWVWWPLSFERVEDAVACAAELNRGHEDQLVTVVGKVERMCSCSAPAVCPSTRCVVHGDAEFRRTTP